MEKSIIFRQCKLSNVAPSSKMIKKKVSEKIDSPIAKYDSSGNLKCIICRSLVKSASVWKVHINSKQHKQKVNETKELRDNLLQKPRTDGQTVNKARSHETVEPSTHILAQSTVERQGNIASIQKSPKTSEEVLPKSFFDDPFEDAKARHVEFKDPLEEEWQRFQREIKEESMLSNEIIAGEQDASAVEREIKDIDEQIEHLAKVIQLEQKKRELGALQTSQKGKHKKEESSCEWASDDNDSGDEFDEFSNWRLKEFHK